MVLTLRSQNGFPVFTSLDKCKILIEHAIQMWSKRLINDGESAGKCLARATMFLLFLLPVPPTTHSPKCLVIPRTKNRWCKYMDSSRVPYLGCDFKWLVLWNSIWWKSHFGKWKLRPNQLAFLTRDNVSAWLQTTDDCECWTLCYLAGSNRKREVGNITTKVVIFLVVWHKK